MRSLRIGLPKNDTRIRLKIDLTGDLIAGSGLFDKLWSAWRKYSTLIVPCSLIATNRHPL
jgi:hypothetical protein